MSCNDMSTESAICRHRTFQIHFFTDLCGTEVGSSHRLRHHICGKSILFQRNHRQADTIYRNTVSDPGSTEYFFCPDRNLPG